ncbi:MAG: autotransporter-associated beta strand repeat-containing protein [Opitutaceae bacterium]|jgi:autotransporter-associated beta strand protein
MPRTVSRLASACALFLLGHSARAATYDWTAATNSTWAAGWTGANEPTTSDDLTVLGPLNAAGALNIDVATAAAANTINFTDTSAVTLTNINSGADQTLMLQSGLTTGTGAVTIGSSTANQGVLIALGASQTWTIGAGGLTANNAISGATFGITKSGTGTLTLNGTNTYTGPTSVTAGTLHIGATGAWSTHAGNTLTVDGGTFKFAGATALTVNQTITVGANGATFEGSGTNNAGSALTLGASTTNSIALSGTAASRTITLAGTYNNGESVTNVFNYKITDDGTGGVTNLVKSGTSNWQLNAANTYSGTTSISGGTLSVSGTNALPTTTGVTFTGNGQLNLVSAANQTIASLNSAFTGANIEDTNGGNGSTTGVLTVTGGGTYAGIISQRSSQFARTVSLTKSGTGTLTLTNNNSYAGGTQVTGGTLAITKAKGLGTGVSGNVGATNTNITTVSGGGTLDLNGSTTAIVVNEAITLNGGNLVNNSTTNATTLDNGVASILVTNKGAGGATAASVSFGGSPTTAATGTVGLGGGILTSFTFTSGSGYTTAPTVTVTATTGSFTTTPTATAVLSSLTLTGTGNTIGGAGNLSINAVVSGTGGGFAKTGNGTVTLNGTNTYTGLTDVQAGTLSLGNTDGLAATGSVTVSGGTLTSSVANVNLGTGAVSMSAGAINPEGTGTAGSFTLAANQAFSTTGGTLNFDLVSSVSFDQIIGSGTGTFSLTGSTLSLSGLTSVAGTYQIFSGFTSGSVSGLTITGLSGGYSGSLDNTGLLTIAIPEPSAFAALAGALVLGFVAFRRRFLRL